MLCINWPNRLEEVRSEIDKSIELIEAKISSLGSFNVIANISYLNQSRDLSDYSDFKHGTLPIVPEYIALMCLKNQYFLGDLEFKNPSSFNQQINEIQELGLKIVAQVPLLRRPSNEIDNSIESTLHQIRNEFESEEYYVRNPAFEEHHLEIIEELFSKFDKELDALLGFTVADGIDLCIAIGGLVHRKLTKHFQQCVSTADEHYYEILRYKAGGKLNNFYPQEILDDLLNLPKKQLREHFHSSFGMYALVTLGHHYSFTIDELTAFSGIDDIKVKAFLDSLSIKFQEVPIDFYEPQGIHPLKSRPIVAGDGRYIVPSQSLLDWSLDKTFESTLLHSQFADKYSAVKGDYLDYKGLELLKTVLPTASTYPNLKYKVGADNGESDGLLILDDCLFIVEAKSHRITDSAKQGEIKRVKRHLDQILRDAYNQAIKTLNYIDSKELVEFKTAGGKSLTLRGKDFRHRFIIITTYEQIGHIASLIKTNNDIKLFDGPHFPYVVSLYDLMVVSDIFDFESLLPFYLQRRSEFFSKKEIEVNDEIDVLGAFLTSKLYTDHLNPEGEFDFIQITGFLDQFNQYYFYKAGQIKKKFPKPSFQISSELKAFILKLEKSGLKNRYSYILFLLSMNGETQDTFFEKVRISKKQYRSDRKLHDFSLGMPGSGCDWGITFMVGSPKDVAGNLIKYCSYKIKQRNYDCWIGLGDAGFSDYQFIEPIILVKPKE